MGKHRGRKHKHKNYGKSYRAFVAVVSAFSAFRETVTQIGATNHSKMAGAGYWSGKVTRVDFMCDVQVVSRRVIERLSDSWPKFHGFLLVVDNDEMELLKLLEQLYGRQRASDLVYKLGTEFLKSTIGLAPVGRYFSQTRGRTYRSRSLNGSLEPRTAPVEPQRTEEQKIIDAVPLFPVEEQEPEFQESEFDFAADIAGFDELPNEDEDYEDRGDFEQGEEMFA